MSRKISARCRLLPGDACQYIKHVDDGIKPGDNVVLACRVSGREQDRQWNLDAAIKSLRINALHLHANVVGIVTSVGPGTEPSWLVVAADMAKVHGA